MLIRPRRLRTNKSIRSLVEETQISLNDLVYPLFIKEGLNKKQEISSMPGQFQIGLNDIENEIKEIQSLGISSVLLFGIPIHKDETGSENYNPDGIIPKAIKIIKEIAPEILVISDMCFCEYTTHGHCGIVNQKEKNLKKQHLPEGYLLNDETLKLLSKASVVHAEAGADIIAPSGMLDGMIHAIRTELDQNKLENTIIMSYAAKYSSSFYGPFREAAEGTPEFGDRSQYQMDIRNGDEALKEVELDIQQGADIVIVKPALAYLDVIARIKDNFNIPIAAYNVSGEYSMLHAAAKSSWLDLEKTMFESLISMKRAGAKILITYFAKEIAKKLN